MVYTRFCRSCKKQVDIEMNSVQLRELSIGIKKMQDIFPEKTPGEREILISGMCEECFDELFSEEDEEFELEDIDIDWNFEDGEEEQHVHD